jgi:hypothetical protein
VEDELLPLFGDADEGCQLYNAQPMRVGHRTGILRLRALMDDILFALEENVANL